jgi:hypothetical protein
MDHPIVRFTNELMRVTDDLKQATAAAIRGRGRGVSSSGRARMVLRVMRRCSSSASASAALDVDPRPAIAQALRAGRFPLAAALVEQWEQRVLRSSGPASRQAAEVAEAQAHVAAASGDIKTGVVRWIVAARILRQHLAADDPELHAAVDNAHALWLKLDRAEALAFGLELAELRRSVDPSGRRLAEVQRRLELHTNAGDFLLRQPLR